MVCWFAVARELSISLSQLLNEVLAHLKLVTVTHDEINIPIIKVHAIYTIETNVYGKSVQI